MAFRPAVPEDDRVHGPESLGVPVEFVELLCHGLLERDCHVESTDSQAIGRGDESIKRARKKVEMKVDGGQAERREGCLVNRRRNRVLHGMAQEAEHDRLAALQPSRGGEGKLTGDRRGTPGRVLEFLATGVRQSPCQGPRGAHPD